MAAKKKIVKDAKKTGVVAKKRAALAKTRAKVRVVAGRAARKRIKAPLAQEAKKLIKRAEVLEKHAARFAKVAVKHRENAAKLAAKALAKPQCRYSPKMQAALAEIAKLGQEVEVPQYEALQVVADVLKGEFK
jgi:hypothetical protein